MLDFRNIFDVSKLDDSQIGHLQFVLNSPSYIDVFHPYLIRMRDSLSSKLLDPSQDRKDNYPDDFIRGGILMIDGLLSHFDHLIYETEIERISRITGELTPNERYEVMRQSGLVRPVSGPIIPEYDPEEDI